MQQYGRGQPVVLTNGSVVTIESVHDISFDGSRNVALARPVLAVKARNGDRRIVTGADIMTAMRGHRPELVWHKQEIDG